MNLHAITLVQDTLAQVIQEEDTAVTLFYNRLFTLDPTLRPLFPANLTEHGRHFLATLHLSIASLSTPEILIPAVKKLGRDHSGYGVRYHHYHTFCQALLWMLAEICGEAFTPKVAEAWTDAFYLLAGLMKEAAAQQNGA